jgi:hypothetical protein
MNKKKLFAKIWLGLQAIGFIYIMIDVIRRDPTVLLFAGSITLVVILIAITAWAATILTINKDD